MNVTEQVEAIAEETLSEQADSLRRAHVVEKRIAGKTFRAIAEEMGFSVGYAHRLYKQAIREREAHNVDEYRILELDRLEWALNQAREAVLSAENINDGMRALAVYLNAERGIRVLVGADAPLRQEVLVLTDEILERKKAELIEERERRLQLIAG